MDVNDDNLSFRLKLGVLWGGEALVRWIGKREFRISILGTDMYLPWNDGFIRDLLAEIYEFHGILMGYLGDRMGQFQNFILGCILSSPIFNACIETIVDVGDLFTYHWDHWWNRVELI